VQYAVRDREIVGKASASRQEGAVFLAHERATESLRHEITVEPRKRTRKFTMPKA